jgi:membrane-associated phospholipid phosphatase
LHGANPRDGACIGDKLSGSPAVVDVQANTKLNVSALYIPLERSAPRMQPIDNRLASRITWRVVMIAQLAMVLTLLMGKIEVVPAQIARVYFGLAVVGALLLYSHHRGMDRLRALFEPLTAGLFLTLPITVATYAAIGMNMPLADAQLAAWDNALGFDWRGFVFAVDSSPAAASLLQEAYASFSKQSLFLLLFLGFQRNAARAYAFSFAFLILCLISSVVSIWFPALGTYVTYAITQDDFANINATYGFAFLEQFHSVREQEVFLLDFDKLAGILTFPSVHAGVAVLCIWAAWDSRLLRYPYLFLNLAMAVSALSHGYHYLVDVIAGFGAAALAIVVSTLVFYRFEPAVSPVLDVWRRYARGISAPASPAASSN